MQTHIPTTSTTDGKQYWMVICDCGMQSSAGICEHVKEPHYFTLMASLSDPATHTNPPGVGSWLGFNFYDLR